MSSSPTPSSPPTSPTIPPPKEVPVSIFDPLPHRYIFLANKTAHLAASCRARTHAIGRPVYVVRDSRGETIGLRVPHYVLEAVFWEEAVREENERDRKEVEKEREGETESLREYTDPGFVQRCVSEDDDEEEEDEEEDEEDGDWVFPNSASVPSLDSDSGSDGDGDGGGISSSDESVDYNDDEGGCEGEYGDGDDDDTFYEANCTCGHVHGNQFWDEM